MPGPTAAEADQDFELLFATPTDEAEQSPNVSVIELRSSEPELSRPRPSRAVLEEIVVTAQKRAEDIQTVPLSVTAIGGKDLVEKNMGDMNEVANYVPNLDVLAVPTFPSIYMRGLGSSYNRGFEQSVAILIDDVFYGRASYINQGLLDLAAIEVLRGPQGSLFGKNSSAGAIHFRTAMPEPEFASHGDVLFGARNHLRLRAIATGPLGDQLSWRLALLDEQRDGSVLNTTTGLDEENRNNRAARLRLQWDPLDSLSLGFTINSSLVKQQGSGSQLILVRDRHLAAMSIFDATTADDPYDGQTAQDYPGRVDRDAYDVTLRADWSLTGEHVVTSISNYTVLDELVDFDADFSPIPFLILDNNEKLRQFSQELRWTSPPGNIDFVGGLYFLQTDLTTNYDIRQFLELNEILQLTGEGERRSCPNDPDPEGCQEEILNDSEAGAAAGENIQARMDAEGGPSPLETSFTDFEQSTQSIAAFGHMNWHFRPRWSLSMGGRFNYEEKALLVDHRLLNNRSGEEGNAVLTGEDGLPLLGFSPGPNPGGVSIFPVIIPGDRQFTAVRERSDFNFIPKLALQYDLTNAAMSYASVARGYKSGGFNAQPVNDQQLGFDEEDAITYELGLKSDWLGGAARVNLALFKTQFDGLQVATFNGVSYVVGNAASADIQGLEYDLQWLTPQGFLLGLNGAITDARYDQFPTAPCGAEVIDPPPCDLSGEKLRLVPKLKTTFTAGWQGPTPVWPLTMTAGLTVNYASQLALATDLDPIDTRVAGTSYGLQLGLSAPDERWHLRVFGDNLSSHESLAGAQDAPAYRGTHFGGAYADASYELQLGFRF